MPLFILFILLYAVTAACGSCSILLLFNHGSYLVKFFHRKQDGKPRYKHCASPAKCIVVSALSIILVAFCGRALPAEAIWIKTQWRSVSEPQAPLPVDASPAPAEMSEVIPTMPPVRVNQDIFTEFYLTNIENSSMLELVVSLTTDENGVCAFTIETFDAAKDKLKRYCEQAANPPALFPFYPGLEDLFPSGSISETFDEVHSLSECDAEIRGAGLALNRHWPGQDYQRISEDFFHIVIRANDALNQGCLEKTGDDLKRSTWIHAETAFAALINQYVFGHPSGPALSNWYYRLGQVLDYLGGIADTKELSMRCYFASTVCLSLAYDELKLQNFPIGEPASYGNEVWDFYFEMLDRIALRSLENADDFYQLLETGASTVLSLELPDDIRNQTEDKLSKRKLYQEWRVSHGFTVSE